MYVALGATEPSPAPESPGKSAFRTGMMGHTGPRDNMSILDISGNFQEWYNGLYALVLTKRAEAGLFRPDTEEFRTDPRFRGLTEADWLEADTKVRGYILSHVHPMLQRWLSPAFGQTSAWGMLAELRARL